MDFWDSFSSTPVNDVKSFNMNHSKCLYSDFCIKQYKTEMKDFVESNTNNTQKNINLLTSSLE